jgi:hypothetical protein
MKNIHILKTEKPSRLLKDLVDGTYQFKKEVLYGNRFELPLSIYITNDEEIKEGDYFIAYSVTSDKKPFISCASEYKERKEDKGKIILTTDQDLIADGVQAIDDEFLEWFVKNTSCEEVYVKDIRTIPALQLGSPNGHLMYEIIIPKEESKFENSIENSINIMSIANSMFGKKEEPKQETIEEAAERWVFETNGHKWSNNDDSAGDNFGSFVAGSKWRSDNSYTRDELKEAYSMGRLGKSIAEFNERFKN